MELLPPPPLGDDEPGPLEHLEVLHDPEAGHLEPPLELAQRLPVALVERVEQFPASRIGKGLEHVAIHGQTISDHRVTCQVQSSRVLSWPGHRRVNSALGPPDLDCGEWLRW